MMHLSYSKNLSQENLFFSEEKIAELISFLFVEIECEIEFLEISSLLGFFPSFLNLHFCDDQEMKKLNFQYRNKNKTTDVLSFAAFEAPEFIEKGFLGDLVVSLEQIQKQAKELNHSFCDELYEIVIHAFLHLFSFDHEDVSKLDAQKMFSLQRKLFLKFKKTIE